MGRVSDSLMVSNPNGLSGSLGELRLHLQHTQLTSGPTKDFIVSTPTAVRYSCHQQYAHACTLHVYFTEYIYRVWQSTYNNIQPVAHYQDGLTHKHNAVAKEQNYVLVIWLLKTIIQIVNPGYMNAFMAATDTEVISDSPGFCTTSTCWGQAAECWSTE